MPSFQFCTRALQSGNIIRGRLTETRKRKYHILLMYMWHKWAHGLGILQEYVHRAMCTEGNYYCSFPSISRQHQSWNVRVGILHTIVALACLQPNFEACRESQSAQYQREGEAGFEALQRNRHQAPNAPVLAKGALLGFAVWASRAWRIPSEEGA